ncbi:MAG: TonB-dependent receptor [Proteobacteria bacterium]|nr:TonB-dependent receptor [Pseudomonadota bacterium]
MKDLGTAIPVSVVAASLLTWVTSATAQETSTSEQSAPQEVVVTGSRIYQTEAQREQPLSTIDVEAIEKSGLSDVGQLLQQLTTGGQALNSKFNSSGNFGYPPDGGGIGAGSAQVSLRNLDSKRVLVLVDGIRWVNESSASGVSGSADINTIPISIVDHIEILEDGASSIYGSDAIAGVVNIITRKKVDGLEFNGYVGGWGRGGHTTDVSMTGGGSTDKFSAMFVASYFNQTDISSNSWWQSASPEPFTGNTAGSSTTPQGRDQFCNPAQPPGAPGYCGGGGVDASLYNITLNKGAVPGQPFNFNDPAASNYHGFDNPDRFNYAPFNLLLTPSQRKSIFTNLSYKANDYVEVYMKGLFITRNSENQAAPEPIVIGPSAGTGGLADKISVSAKNPFNPFGIDLVAPGSPQALAGEPVSLAGFVTRRPIEAGPRQFNQDVNTYYFGTGLRGSFELLGNDYHWDANYVNSANKASQTFTGGYNIGNIQIALGDPAICALVPNCTPLDLFGGQTRPITPAQLKYIQAIQIDRSEQDLKIYSVNVTGHPFSIQDRPVGIAVGGEHRMYTGIFNPDPLRQEGLSQDSLAFPVNASYSVNEAYGEFSVPVLQTLGASAAVRYSDYSSFGSQTTYKVGMRWQPVEDFGLRGNYSTGFRAPNLGELFGLTQFAATLVDPCGPTGSPPVVTPTATSALAAACRSQGVPNGFQQANTQISSFTGGNAKLRPEKSDSYTAGFVYNASWARGLFFTNRMTLEATYYHDKIKGAIQAEDIQQLLNTCLAAGGSGVAACGPFSRQANGNLNPPQNFLANLGQITTSGEDIKFNWASEPFPFGHFSIGTQATRVNTYEAVDQDGNVAQRTVGIEVNNSAIPRWRMNAQLGYGIANLEATWSVRYLSAVSEFCGNAISSKVPGCAEGQTLHALPSVTYNDINVAWNNAFALKDLTVSVGAVNAFGKSPPVCYSCSLNGYDAGTYDLPGAFWNARLKYKF